MSLRAFFARIGRLYSPVRIDVLFEPRPYRLGETIEIAINVVTRDQLNIGRGRADLVGRGIGVAAGDDADATPTLQSPYVHSSMVFSGRTTIRAGGEQIFGADLRLGHSIPRGLDAARVRWKVVIAFELLDGRTFSSEQGVRIRLA